MPLSVTVPAGQTQASFTILTKDVAATTKATLTATAGGQATSAVLSISPAPPVVTVLGVFPNPVVGRKPATGDVRLNKPAPAGGTVVKLASSKTAVATVPASITIAAGSMRGLFTISTKAVTASTTVVISASAGGQTKAVTLTVNKPLIGLRTTVSAMSASTCRGD